MINIISPVISYFIGSIPFGFIIARVAKGIDIREAGSGNPGATNVWRVMGKKYGILVFILDMMKGFLPVLIFDYVTSGQSRSLYAILCGTGVILGHTFPVFLGFKGGKAAATGCGVFLWLAPLPLFISVAAWLLTTFISRYVSLGSMVSTVVLVISIILLNNEPFGSGLSLTLFSIFISLFLIFRHKSNIKRIINGTENKIGRKTKN
ncbi:MAG: glycerol-3-phosphate 1-O-acyltransferase PlsY [Candidatus Kuenenia stuttgartiensis]|jgi:glycerol-3-phosphate acyltransferase PlsY|nr:MULTISPECIES: glycerol-3-phosphate 1-O-acyltransferase PlsY [Kuenenia]MBZ0190889.1 glycerol-3-phosphate 1-O-acyltransferase PlsY [Candidatus Kuenenia stuttgartiensis]MCL4727057.1 glycerol-3-phosphate 1-O-acyltransferase PlsY [Candidatus Kuenenia stuttgartiensis]MCZ7621898.1 glycerol-3-phosphate 1-O-acyltransferase PlsY [Candidatus Kuenenia sp.]